MTVVALHGVNDNSLKQAKEIIYSVDLTPVTDRLVKVEDWSKKDALEAVKQYRNYLFLRKKYPQYTLPPSKDIDEAWHAHVLHTQDYRNFCTQVFSNEENQFLDHHPHVAKEGSMERVEQLFEKTQELYKQEFGECIYQITGLSFSRRFLTVIKGILLAKFPGFTAYYY